MSNTDHILGVSAGAQNSIDIEVDHTSLGDAQVVEIGDPAAGALTIVRSAAAGARITTADGSSDPASASDATYANLPTGPITLTGLKKHLDLWVDAVFDAAVSSYVVILPMIYDGANGANGWYGDYDPSNPAGIQVSTAGAASVRRRIVLELWPGAVVYPKLVFINGSVANPGSGVLIKYIAR